MKQNKLTIDLAQEKFNFYELQNLNEITEIRFDNYTDKIEIPLAINDHPNISKLYFSGKSREQLYETPENLEKCIHIKKLTLWSYCDFTNMQPMHHLERLNIVVKNTETDTRNIIALFPNLKRMEIWGGHLENQKLPDEIGNLTSLESLHLVSCGLNDLPNSFSNLKQLKELNLRGLGIDVFPEVITQLENLEILEFQQATVKLPDDLSNLKKLRKLNLNSALNGANMDVAGNFLNEDKIYLKPIPEVIGKLENLEDLNLGICGVFDVTPILSLQKLKKLNLKYSALKNCDDFSNFLMLEELNLETSYNLKNLDGLKGLPLKKLIISSDYSIKSIQVISYLELLEALNIEGCSNIKDYSPFYSNSSIKKLEADSKIFKKWKKRAEYNKLPKIPAIIDQLKTDELQQFEEAIYHLSKHVDANYSDENNPLAGYFDIEADEEETTFIEVLDTAIQKHLKSLSDETLVTIFGMTFKTVGNDNYNAALLTLEEIITRRNIETQQQIVKEFYKACKYYDAGHRYWTYTVHDQLIDTLFAQFTSEALYKLLKKASTDILNSQGGDAMDALFVPAFKNTTDIQLQEKLLNVFFKYEVEARTYYGKAYFDGLMQQIEEDALPELEKLILAKKEEGKEQEEWLSLLENLNADNLPEVIETFINKSPENLDENEEDFYKIIDASKNTDLEQKSVENLLNFIVENDKTHYLDEILIAKYHQNSPEKSIDFLKLQIRKNSFESRDVFYILKNIIIKLIRLNVPLKELKIYEDYIANHCNVSFDEVYNIEIVTLLDKFFNHQSYGSDEDISWVLRNANTVMNKISNQASYQELRYNTYSLMDSEEYDRVKEAFEVLYPKTKELKEEGVLFYNIIAAIKLNDEPYFDLLYNEVQQLKKIKEVLLAFNLACGFAHFGRKDEMLFYIQESIRLGKMKKQFLDDEDFEKYWEDNDFLKVIEEK